MQSGLPFADSARFQQAHGPASFRLKKSETSLLEENTISSFLYNYQAFQCHWDGKRE